MERAAVNDPSSYYALEEEPSLAWEMTICQCLSSRASPYLTALRQPKPYGEIVADFLADRGVLHWGTSLVEVGGGRGSLMAALLDVMPAAEVTMVDLSPFFLEHQRRAVGRFSNVTFVRSDAAAFFRTLHGEVDLVVSNENLGDLRTYTNLPKAEVLGLVETDGWQGRDDVVSEVAAKASRYGLDLSDAPESFAFNMGAIEYLEALAPKARAVFLVEHGADTVVPPAYAEFVSCEATGYPRRIPLKGHDEYTIHFGHLAAVARRLGYRVERLHLMEVLDLRFDEGVRFMVRAPTVGNEVAEVVHEFYHHVAEYQAMMLVRSAAGQGRRPPGCP